MTEPIRTSPSEPIPVWGALNLMASSSGFRTGKAMMCGNASRCIGKYVYDKRLTNKKNITLETLSGIKELQLTTRKLSGPHEEVTVRIENTHAEVGDF